MEGKRKLAAIMFTDIAGYSALSHRNEELALRLLDEHNRIIRPILERYSGHEIKTIGDAFLVDFDSALNAVQSALEIQSILHSRNESSEEGERIQVRISIHLGDVLVTAGDVFGDGVNIAARLQSVAPQGGLCVSGSVYDQVHNKIEVPFEFLGQKNFKGISKAVPVYVVRGSDSNQLRHRVKSAARTAGTDRSRVAVLPFESIGSNQSDDYLSDGMTEELISDLSRVESIRVMARGSILQYKHTQKTPAQIASELRSGTLVEGTVSTSGNQLRISVQVIDGVSQENLWSQDYDGKVEDAFNIRKQIATRLTRQFGVGRSIASAAKMNSGARDTPQDSHNGEAYLHYLRGRYFMNKRTEEGLQKAYEELQASIAKDSKFAPAYATLANVIGLQAFYGTIAPGESDARLRGFVSRALELDPLNTEALLSLAENTAYQDLDWLQAERRFQDAIASNPRNPTAHQWYGEYLIHRERTGESYVEVDQAVRLDPLSLVTNVSSGVMRYYGGDTDEAIRRYLAVIEMDPNFMLGHYWLGRALIEKHQFGKAVSELENAVTLSQGAPMMKAALAQALFRAGHSDRGMMIVHELKALNSRYVSHYDLALAYSGMRDARDTVAELRLAVEQKASRMPFVGVEPSFAFLHAHPDFRAVAGRFRVSER